MVISNSNKVSIVVVSNPLSVLMANQIAFNTVETDIKILLIDYGKKKESFLTELITCAKKENWNSIINLSETINDDKNSKPNLTKRLTRKYKFLPILKTIHGVLQKKLLLKIENEIEQKLTKELEKYFSSDSVNLFLLTQTYSNSVLLKLFPKASINYYEHGIGDYALAASKTSLDTMSFYGLFSNEYKKYNLNSKLNYLNIEFNKSPKIEAKSNILEKNSVLIILQNLEIYSLTMDFWKTYFLDIIAIESETSTYLIKPHPLQSNETIEYIHRFFMSRKIKFTVLAPAKSMELEFEGIFSEVKVVYSPFSSSLFYLSKIYKNEKIKFYHSITRVKNNIGKSPEQYKIHFTKNYPIIKNVFGINCDEFD